MGQLTRLSITVAMVCGFIVGTAPTAPARAITTGATAHPRTVVVGKGQTVTVTAKRRTKVVVVVKPGPGVDFISIAMHGDVDYNDGQHGIVNVNPATTSYHQVCAKVGPCKCPEGTWQDGPAFDESVGLGSFTITLVGGKKRRATAVLHGSSMNSDECTKHDPCLLGTWRVTDMTGYFDSLGAVVDSTSGMETYTFYGRKKNWAAQAQAQSYTIVLEDLKDKHGTITSTLNGTATASNWITPQRGTLQLTPSGSWAIRQTNGLSEVTVQTDALLGLRIFGPWAHQATSTYVCNSNLAGVAGAELQYSPLPNAAPIVMTRVGN